MTSLITIHGNSSAFASSPPTILSARAFEYTSQADLKIIKFHLKCYSYSYSLNFKCYLNRNDKLPRLAAPASPLSSSMIFVYPKKLRMLKSYSFSRLGESFHSRIWRILEPDSQFDFFWNRKVFWNQSLNKNTKILEETDKIEITFVSSSVNWCLPISVFDFRISFILK